MSSIEILRALHSDPIDFSAAVGPYLNELGVVASVTEEPDRYIAQTKEINPRYLDEIGNPLERSISRQELGERPDTPTLDPDLERYCRLIGVIGAEYGLDGRHELSDATLVTGGVMSAIEDRTRFALASDVDRPVFMSGSPRERNNAETTALEEL